MIPSNKPAWIITDIEGTTTDISFVFNVLFPYFRENLKNWANVSSEELDAILIAAQTIVQQEEGTAKLSRQDLLDKLFQWSLEDRKVTPLKELQGLVWKKGFESGELKGHVYPDVLPALNYWKSIQIQLAVFSSGSVSAQKQLFGNSVEGDLTSYFRYFFDTHTGPKREAKTYLRMAELLCSPPGGILFLSDVKEELEAAQQAGYQTIQLLRPGTKNAWPRHVLDFSQITF
jgi:enolase-phosphatase E1